VAPLLLNDMATPEGLASRVLDALPANTSLANLSGHPALAVPSGADEDGLPTSVQLMGRMWRDDTTLAAGHVVEGALSR
jgi:Asp-tRNA(Asn)/Glu-tRNA(Gln) amidotransferase A subunit family amidase